MTDARPRPPAPAHVIREVAVAAGADPRTVERVLRGEHARGMVHDRILRACAERGIAPADTSESER